jgi:SIR2-like domain
MTIQPKAYNDHNVYILGAGFGTEAGLPLIKGFMNRMRDAAAGLANLSGREREVQAIERVLELRLRATAAAYRLPLDCENIEELFSLASGKRRRWNDRSHDMGNRCHSRLLALVGATARRARALWYRDKRAWMGKTRRMDDPPAWLKGRDGTQPARYCFSCSPYDFYVGTMAAYFEQGGPNRRDTIMTFNYDMLIEDVLRRLSIPFDYGISKDSILFHNSAHWIEKGSGKAGLKLRKLHGSVNCAAHVFGDHATLKEYREFDSMPFLSPPTWQKGFGRHLSDVRDAAVDALRTATRIIILGYSIPATDQHFRYLLAAGLQDNISLRNILFVNPGLKEAESKAQLEARLFGLFRREHFEQGIIELIAADTREFFTGPPTDILNQLPYRARIGRPLNKPGTPFESARWLLYASPGSWSAS